MENREVYCYQVIDRVTSRPMATYAKSEFRTAIGRAEALDAKLGYRGRYTVKPVFRACITPGIVTGWINGTVQYSR